MLEDTIAAIATPEGVGGIGIIRISGPKAEDILNALFRPKKKTGPFKTHHLYHGEIISPGTNTSIDEVLVSLMKKPHSYTGEDTLEINCHGGPVILKAVLNEAVRAGARLASPGEFTKRAFLNNRLDLSQAESVIEMIEAKTARGLELALSHHRGELSERINSLRTSLIEILAHMETAIDFSEEDVDPEPTKELFGKIRETSEKIEAILSTYREGRIAKEGLTVVITGKPNVGKSSLLNRLVGEKRAIVTHIPGTTRDFIEEVISIKGIPVKFVDTAGIRASKEEIEKEGIAFVWEKAGAADVVIILIDGSEELTEEDFEIIEKNRGRTLALVVNKSDLPARITKEKLGGILPDFEPLWISAKFGDGIPALKEKIYSLVSEDREDMGQDVVLTNLRHKDALERAASLLGKAGDTIIKGFSPELLSIDIREALDHLGEIVGTTTNEDVLDKIFSSFCIGK